MHPALVIAKSTQSQEGEDSIIITILSCFLKPFIAKKLARLLIYSKNKLYVKFEVFPFEIKDRKTGNVSMIKERTSSST